MESRCASVHFSHADPCEGNQRALLITADAAELLNPTCHSSSVPSSANCRVLCCIPRFLSAEPFRTPRSQTQRLGAVSLSLSVIQIRDLNLLKFTPTPPASFFISIVSLRESGLHVGPVVFLLLFFVTYGCFLFHFCFGENHHTVQQLPQTPDQRNQLTCAELLLLAWSFKLLCKSSVVFSFIYTSGLKVSPFYEH